MFTELDAHWLTELLGMPLFTVGATSITFARLLGALAIVIGVWWSASALERVFVGAVRRRSQLPGSMPGIYAWSRIARYCVWIVGTVVGLDFLGVDLTSVAFLGGAIGIGIGFGLQNIFSNFISGVILLFERSLKIGDFVDLQSGVRGHAATIEEDFEG